MELDQACVYTIATPENLFGAAKSEEHLHEAKVWVTPKKLHQVALREGLDLPRFRGQFSVFVD